ncbi:hypothetical protein [Desulfitobacterium metallireducens]|uniref:DUF2680 domain-containing protein n=1 Tax=Desulfitobacterium metallireducens DSM 15288 TaxID=871968 RepID=W0EFD3_9FIRM|nr:hypothetical protein [Desulfitobacterium metallireducens]AHF08203.1 hypothetical protein DESME_15115 [Desulfitobacterium metallireducens DSM 15288]
MKFKKQLIAVIATLGILGVAGTALAADGYKTPADIVAGLTGKTVEQVTTERATGVTYGTIANDAGVLDSFKQEILAQKEAVLDQRVAEGTMTQEQAASVKSALEANQATCDGTGSAQIGRANGVGFGSGMMQGQGRGQGRGGFGGGMGYGVGMGRAGLTQ